ncbi:hypothetical protein [Nocardioides ferulae]|uniref:hypothetical protein n=1 Tax=Nocardioides ferulae TaxID=2340821 RepID=UPI000EB4CFC5|nr:hypothetical protein [Nocardioides ferulae]
MSTDQHPEPHEIADLDARATLAAVTDATTGRRAVEVTEMRLAAHWAALHGEPVREAVGELAGLVDPMTHPGGDGTPAIREVCIAELGMARQTHAATARALIADTLDLHHRLPATWKVVEALGCEPWVARRVAVMSRGLDADKVGLVDRAVAKAIGKVAPGKVFDLTAAKIIEADPEAHTQRRERARHERYVKLSKTDEHGFRHIIARVTAGDAVWFDALVDRVADILALEHGHDHNHQELRSLAVGWLARPADLLRLLLDHTYPEQADSEHDDDPEPEAEAAEPAGRPAYAPEHLDATLDRLKALTARQLASLRPRGKVFVHLHQAALQRQAGIARVEGLGPMLAQCLAELLGHADVKLQPVLDLATRPRVDAYEHPERLKDHIWLLAGGDVFPYATAASRDQTDADHVVPYKPPDEGGPSGQTGPHNSAPLRRRHHRWKTHGGYRSRSAGPGRYLWQSPHGPCAPVDDQGTHPLTEQEADLILTAPPGLEIYLPGPAGVDVLIDPSGDWPND